MMVMRAAELVAARREHASRFLRRSNTNAQTQRLYACLPDLSHLQRTGRIGKAQAVLGTLMKIVPVLALKDGQVAAEAQVRTFSRAQETMLDLALEGATDVAKARFLGDAHECTGLAAAALEKLRERLGGVQPLMLDVLEAGPVIATHGGPGAVGIFVAQDD